MTLPSQCYKGIGAYVCKYDFATATTDEVGLVQASSLWEARFGAGVTIGGIAIVTASVVTAASNLVAGWVDGFDCSIDDECSLHHAHTLAYASALWPRTRVSVKLDGQD